MLVITAIIRDQDIKHAIGRVGPGKMYYIIYKVTNQLNGKYYIGRHATNNIHDNYMGSGLGIKNAIKKYGLENFTKEIIAEARTAEDLWHLEKDIVNNEVVKDPMSYNNAYGGKHYLHGLKEYDYNAFIEHQQNAGRQYAKNFSGKDKSWHAKGGSASSRKRSVQYKYCITTNIGDQFIVNGLEFKALCKEKGWNYNTLHWKKSMGKFITRGPHKGFLVEQISTCKEVVICY